MKKNKRYRRVSGFTLVETILFVGLISIVFITFSALTTTSLKITKLNEQRILATHYAEELREWLAGERDSNWGDFYEDRMGTWCFNSEPVSGWGTTGQTCGYDLDATFKRQVTMTARDATSVSVDINVSWMEGSTIHNVPVTTVFTILE